MTRPITTAWTPEGFDAYHDEYPATPALLPEPSRAPTGDFIARWHALTPERASAHLLSRPVFRPLRDRASDTTIVFVRGFLGNYVPRNLVRPRDALRRLGLDAFIVRNHAVGTVEGNLGVMARDLARRRSRGDIRQRLVFCAHSRGGVEVLLLLARDEELAARCDGVVLSQTPRGPSRVIESVLLRRHQASLSGTRRRVAEQLQRAGLIALRARTGAFELTEDVWPALAARAAASPRSFPVLQTASWSARPTAWLDSFHNRMSELGPGRAHDGQFFLDDLIWPSFPHVLLPHVDHAQPVIGGLGFDHARYWIASLLVLLDGTRRASEATR